MHTKTHAFTLIETAVVGATVALAGTVLTATLARMNEEARTAKCQNNLKRVISAVGMYTLDYGGYLPGPLHPAIIRGAHNLGGLEGDHPALREDDKRKSLTWSLRAYFPPVGDSAVNPNTANPIVDELFRCPTAEIVAPDQDFYESSAVLGRPYNYVLNSFGPLSCPTSSTEWFHTDPPMYFGGWYYMDSWPETASMSPTYKQRAWRPKRIAQIKLPAAEWAVADAWYRHVPTQPVRPGGAPQRNVIGPFPSGWAGQPLPSAPYHRVPLRQARSTRHSQSDNGRLPAIDFAGKTNQAHFDGHVSAFRGNWRDLGDGGTASPYWHAWGGTNTTWNCPY